MSSPSILFIQYYDTNVHSPLLLQALRAEYEHKADWLLPSHTPQRKMFSYFNMSFYIPIALWLHV